MIELAPEDYSYELLSSTMAAADAGSWAKHGAYAAAWKYLIYVLIMKEISARGGKGAVSVIRKYLHDNHPDPHAGTLTLLVSYLKRLEGIKIGPIKAGSKSRELDRLYKLEEIHRLLPELTEIISRRRVVVLVDELDRGWDSSEDASEGEHDETADSGQGGHLGTGLGRAGQGRAALGWAGDRRRSPLSARGRPWRECAGHEP